MFTSAPELNIDFEALVVSGYLTSNIILGGQWLGLFVTLNHVVVVLVVI